MIFPQIKFLHAFYHTAVFVFLYQVVYTVPVSQTMSILIMTLRTSPSLPPRLPRHEKSCIIYSNNNLGISNVLTNPYGSPWLSIGSSGSVRLCMAPYCFLWLPMATYSSLCLPMGIYGTGIHGCTWVYIGKCSYMFVHMGINGYIWVYIGINEYMLVYMGICRYI